MVEKILTWLLTKVLEYLFGKAEKAITKQAEVMEKEKERGEINEENIKKYEATKDRVERIKAAKHLLNGTKS